LDTLERGWPHHGYGGAASGDSLDRSETRLSPGHFCVTNDTDATIGEFDTISDQVVEFCGGEARDFASKTDRDPRTRPSCKVVDLSFEIAEVELFLVVKACHDHRNDPTERRQHFRHSATTVFVSLERRAASMTSST
jgi:hypothetical protein